MPRAAARSWASMTACTPGGVAEGRRGHVRDHGVHAGGQGRDQLLVDLLGVGDVDLGRAAPRRPAWSAPPDHSLLSHSRYPRTVCSCQLARPVGAGYPACEPCDHTCPAEMAYQSVDRRATGQEQWVTEHIHWVSTQKVQICEPPAPGAGAHLGGLPGEATCAWSVPHSRSRWRAPRWPWPRPPSPRRPACPRLPASAVHRRRQRHPGRPGGPAGRPLDRLHRAREDHRHELRHAGGGHQPGAHRRVHGPVRRVVV